MINMQVLFYDEPLEIVKMRREISMNKILVFKDC